MIIRKYLVDNINEALFRIKHELGDDAYIISQKMVRQPGVKGFFSNKKLEITVGLIDKENQENQYVSSVNEFQENKVLNSLNAPSVNSQLGFSENNLNGGVFTSEEVAKQPQNDIPVNNYQQNNSSQSMSYYNKLFEEKQKMFNGSDKDQSLNVNLNENDFSKIANTYVDNVKFKNSRQDDSYKSSIIDLNLNQPSDQYSKNINTNTNISNHNISNHNINNHSISNNVSSNNNTAIQGKTYSKEEIMNQSFKNNQKSVENYGDLKKDIKEIKNILIGLSLNNNKKSTESTLLDDILYKQGICKELCDEIKLNCNLSDEELKNITAVKKYLRGVFSNIVRVNNEDLGNRVVLVGPTGSGKTTTVAKIAGMLTLNLNKKAGLVTIDTFRVGAIEQLKVYSEIMNIPYKFANCLNDIRTVFDDMKACDIVLIDTIGRGNKNIIQLNELNMFVQSMQANEISLVISAGMKYQDVELFMNSIKGIEFNNVIITKVDETNSFGMFVNICYKTGLPISFITMGQDVPVDIKKANKKEILDMVLGEEEL